MTTLINEHTLTTPLLHRAGELARQLETLAGELQRLTANDGFLRQAHGHEFTAVHAAAAAARTASVDVHLVVSELHGRALAADDYGHGYRVTDTCPMCDAEAAPLLESARAQVVDELSAVIAAVRAGAPRNEDAERLLRDQAQASLRALNPAAGSTEAGCPACGARGSWRPGPALSLVCDACGHHA